MSFKAPPNQSLAHFSCPFFSLSPFREAHLFTIHHTCLKHSCPCSFISTISLARNACSMYTRSSLEAEPKSVLLNEVFLIIKAQVLHWLPSLSTELPGATVYCRMHIYLLSLVEFQCAFCQGISIHIFSLPRVLRCRVLCIMDIQILVDWLIHWHLLSSLQKGPVVNHEALF